MDVMDKRKSFEGSDDVINPPACMRSVQFSVTLMPTCLLLNQQHMIADTVRMIRHCQSEQPGGCSHSWIELMLMGAF